MLLHSAVAAIVLAVACVQAAPIKSFGDAIKQAQLHGSEEFLLFSFDDGPGWVAEQWFTGQGAMDENCVIAYYIDGEAQASLEFNVLMAHGIGFGEAKEAPNTPWDSKFLGHDSDGAVYNTYRIPFAKSIRISARRPHAAKTEAPYFWYIVRGVTNAPVRLGDLRLPASTRLRLYETDRSLKPYEFVDFVSTPAGKQVGGALFQVTFATNSSVPFYLEGCVRAYIDGGLTTNRRPMFLSSGTEDFFLSSYYFNRGLFHGDEAGLTYKEFDKNTSTYAVGAYKFFHADPVLFSEDFILRWRNGELLGTGIDDCPNAREPTDRSITSQRRDAFRDNLGAPKLAVPQSTQVRTYAFVYEWDADEAPTAA